ncbi:phenylalanine--tRNA ligase subunit beta [Candidatus Peregrinibacteria bacterium]|nr:phenylalanine--tRNA ligase subunit beta [Candidatus Peregrinibacteria bacterium]
MKISLNWLREFVNIPHDANAKYLAELFTTKTAEVENVYDEAGLWKNIFVGQVLEIHKHPNADKLRIAKVSLGKKTINLVCGGNNLREGMYTAIALPDAMVKWHGENEYTELQQTSIRGVKSEGMICAKEEIGLEEGVQPTGGIADLSAIKPEVGAPLAKALAKNDTIFEIENKSLTHRPDLWGHYGIAREFAAILDKKIKPLTPKIKFPEKGRQIKVTVKNPKLCPRYAVVIIENIKVGESPEWLKEKLRAVGRGIHNNMVDVTNYITELLGQPMHAFDLNNIHEEVIIRNAEENEKMITLDGKTRTLSKDIIVISDKKGIIGMPIMGGQNSETTEKTTVIMLEAANFDPVSVRKASFKLDLRTEAAQRFEKHLDPNLVELGLKMACEIILKICPGSRIAGPATDIKNFNTKSIKVDLNVARTQSMIGAKISMPEMIKILQKLEFNAAKKSSNIISVIIPSFRATKDIDIEEDLIEEISRMHGYDKIPSILPELPTKLPLENIERKLKYTARNILSLGLGFTEMQSYSFYGAQEISSSRLPEELHLKLENYLSSDQTHLRISLVPNMLRAVKQNIYSFDTMKIYEIGRTYLNGSEYFPIEEKYICGMIIESKKSGAGKIAEAKEIFYSAKGALDNFLESFGTPDLNKKRATNHHFYVNPVKQLVYTNADNEEIAKVFEIHPAVLKNFDLEEVCVGCFEINFSKLALMGTFSRKYKPIPKYPEIKIDVSVIMPEEKTVEEAYRIIKSADAAYIANVELFDIFKDKSIGAGKRALAFKITLRSDERTLTLEDMNKIQKKIFDNLKHSGGVIRGL